MVLLLHLRKNYAIVTSVDAKVNIGESYSGSIAVSKTVHGGSNPSSPASKEYIFGCALFL